jgi:hypothetical protein
MKLLTQDENCLKRRYCFAAVRFVSWRVANIMIASRDSFAGSIQGFAMCSLFMSFGLILRPFRTLSATL